MAELIFHPEAKIEIRDAAEYYENCREGLGLAYLSAVESTVKRLTLNPSTWRKIRGPFRRILIDKFPYGGITNAAQRKTVRNTSQSTTVTLASKSG